MNVNTKKNNSNSMLPDHMGNWWCKAKGLRSWRINNNQILVIDRLETKYEICEKIYDLIYELNVIAPSILRGVLPQLKCKLKSTNEDERLAVVSLLSRMFSEKSSDLSTKYPTLPRMLLGRFCDIAVAIRSHLRPDISECLRVRQHDSAENVRYEVVMAIVETAKRPESSADPQTLHILPEFMLAFAIPVLVHRHSFTNYQDRAQLKQIEKGLRKISSHETCKNYFLKKFDMWLKIDFLGRKEFEVPIADFECDCRRVANGLNFQRQCGGSFPSLIYVSAGGVERI
uniref:Uncharacterized protein n=1 Tax=Glossina austeni TaxID=7395 RepID=A0A1A9URD0_GLOAU